MVCAHKHTHSLSLSLKHTHTHVLVEAQAYSFPHKMQNKLKIRTFAFINVYWRCPVNAIEHISSLGHKSYIFTGIKVLGHSLHRDINTTFDVLLTVHLSIFISVITQLDAQHFCFKISLFHASTCFEQMCSSSGDQNCISQLLVSSYL